MRALQMAEGAGSAFDAAPPRLSFDVPMLPLFVHERLSTKAIVDTLVGHRRHT
jgi:hypothetical protein